MKRVVVKILIAIMSVTACLLSFAGCNGSGTTGENILNIGYYEGGYGTKWAESMAAEFEKQNPGVDVIMDNDPYIVGRIPGYLEDGSVHDIFFSHGIEWEASAASGWLEPLDDLYQTEVAPGVKVEDRVLEQFKENSKFKGRGDSAKKYYKLHWTNGVGGIVYNKKMFDENGWKEPTTYEELEELCATIYNANIPSPGNPDERVRPFVFSKEDYYWDYLTFDWMLQLCGKEAYDEFLKLETPEVFNPASSAVVKAQKEALDKWNNLVGKNTNYSMRNSIGKEYQIAQSDFINGNAAMIPNAQWLENEMIENIDESKCVMAMMPAPILENALKDSAGNPIRYSRAVGGDDSIIVPSKAPNKPLAKKFLQFMCKEETAVNFTKDTYGVMLGLKYDIDKLNAIEGMSSFMKSVFEINTSSIKYDNYSDSLLRLNGKIKCEWFTVTGFAPYPDVIKNPNMDTSNIFSSYYDHVKNNWSKWGGKTA